MNPCESHGSLLRVSKEYYGWKESEMIYQGSQNWVDWLRYLWKADTARP